MLKVYASGFSRSRRALWACEEVGAPYEVVELEWPPSQHPEFLEISPAGTVPAIQDGEVRLIESLAICEYVSRTYGGDLVVEPGDRDYYEYLQFTQYGEATLQPPVVWARRFGPYSPKIVAGARDDFAARLRVIEGALADGREFLTAGRFTVADLSVGFVLVLSKFLGFADLHPPTVKAYVDRLRTRPAYRKAYGLD